ncbi:Scytalone dehydratase [Pyrenophora tritici-repentis]|uniref:Scytalone dehydratase n=2 Tax=Pyrenophora tritici-repentis TaxID=45151 RepID=A0A2W1D6M5_9PLEO|nr:scytalone dehydratase [Pyrenophora tritici-repentis Pt-1C-BFP]KAA8623213.1 Scytalone dehydratase [Pyrenophora tritici-repentis]EDU45246.1 scytalone dehydratase [Pyrenophora tritici-repentis Pt-1C-BFP]KAF7452209.1 Scytalone dehydratase [Pyrenophora tritici-repentis]KAF7574672.1 scytalone dehydratase [Pyrenophora tritici-repentis]KAI0569228.1 Scytalone dehydratase [Pyrenophora tritici-repentis]
MSTFATEKRPAPEDIIGCQAAAFEWTESYDTKDWTRLAGCVAPTLYLDYTSVLNKKWESLPAPEFIALASSPHFLGNALIKTQHFMGQTRWILHSDEEIRGHHQMRVAHQRFKDDEMNEVACVGHAHGAAIVHYKKVEGVWKFAGLEPDIRWSEGEYARIFAHE